MYGVAFLGFVCVCLFFRQWCAIYANDSSKPFTFMRPDYEPYRFACVKNIESLTNGRCGSPDLPLEKGSRRCNRTLEASVRGTARLCDLEKRTVLNILKLAGERCEQLLTEQIHNVRVRDLELDEVWTFVGCKQKRLTPQRVEQGMAGDAYTFIALERTSKLVVAWHLGKRDRINTEDFVSKIRWATAPGWFDVSTDAFQPYETAIDAGLYDRANHAQVARCSRPIYTVYLRVIARRSSYRLPRMQSRITRT